MNKAIAYQALVEMRKKHRFPEGLLNPAEIEGGRFDSNHVSPWSRWQGSLDADVLIVGQDWGDLPYFLRNGGVDDDHELTCTNLREMALAAGWDIGTPHAPLPQRLFFTNAVLGIRAAAGKSGTPPVAWVKDSLHFLVALLDVIQPKVVVSLGTAAYRACRLAIQGSQRDSSLSIGAPLSQIHAQNPILRPGKPTMFAFYHCGPLGLVNRSRELQRQDWKHLRQHLDLESLS